MTLPNLVPVPTTREIALLALQIALGYAAAHIHEEGGNNRGDQVEFFQRLMGGARGDSWCADFVCCCLVKAFARAYGLQEDRSLLPGYVQAASHFLTPLSGSCSDLAEGARERYRLRSKEFVPAPGDLVLFDFTGAGKPHHCGIVELARRTTLLTVEGNTVSGNPGSQSDGDGVFRRSRSRDHVFGFVEF